MIHSFVLFILDGSDPPPLPWAADCEPTSPRVARWQRLDGQVIGDGQVMQASLFGLVIADRDPQSVIDAFFVWAQQPVKAALILHRHGSEQVEEYDSQAGTPRLLSALRDRNRGGLVS